MLNLLYLIYIRIKSDWINNVPVNIVEWYTKYYFYSPELGGMEFFFSIKQFFFLKQEKNPGLLVLSKSVGHSVRDI